MAKLNGTRRAFAALAAAAAVLALASAGCQNNTTAPTSPYGTFVLINACGAQVKAYVDGTEKATIETEAQVTVTNVLPGSRQLEIKKASDGLSIFNETLTIAANTVNYVSVRGIGTVQVTNLYGEVLSIYDGDAYIGDIGDQLTQTITRIDFGTHTYKAMKRSDGTKVAEVAIDIEDFTAHVWTITP